MIVERCMQRDDEWWRLRLGRPTASNFGKIITPTGKPSAQAQKYCYQLAGERVAGIHQETYQSAAMERGVELEAEARSLFELVMDVEVREVGLVYANEDREYSCSPDGLLNDAGLEIKCPLIHTHVGYLLGNKVPTEYIPQIQGSMLVTGFSHYFFMSYYPGLKPLILDVRRDDEFCEALKYELDIFCDQLNSIEARLRELND